MMKALKLIAVVMALVAATVAAYAKDQPEIVVVYSTDHFGGDGSEVGEFVAVPAEHCGEIYDAHYAAMVGLYAVSGLHVADLMHIWYIYSDHGYMMFRCQPLRDMLR